MSRYLCGFRRDHDLAASAMNYYRF
jgi:hypothetical protein